jgi:hypothetical protein
MSTPVSYNYTFDCTYKDIENKYFNDNKVEVDDVLFLCEEIYRFEFLKCFNVDEFDDNVVNSLVKKLCADCCKDLRFKAIIDLVSEHMQEQDLEICFMQLFSYPYLHLTQSCIKQLYTCKQLGEVTQQCLIDAYNRVNCTYNLVSELN